MCHTTMCETNTKPGALVLPLISWIHSKTDYCRGQLLISQLALLNRTSQEREKPHRRLTAAALSPVFACQNLIESIISSVFFVRRQYSHFAAMYLELASVSFWSYQIVTEHLNHECHRGIYEVTWLKLWDERSIQSQECKTFVSYQFVDDNENPLLMDTRLTIAIDASRHQVKPSLDSQDLTIQNVKTDTHGNTINAGETKHTPTLTGVATNAAHALKPAQILSNTAGSASGNHNNKSLISSAPLPSHNAAQTQHAAPALTNTNTKACNNATQSNPFEKVTTNPAAGSMSNPPAPPLQVTTASQPPLAAPSTASIPKKSRFTVKSISVLEVNKIPYQL